MTAMPARTDIGRCRACPQTIRWVVLKSGKRNPLNPDPDPERGNVMIIETDAGARAHGTIVGRAVVLGHQAAAHARGQGVDLYSSHFATCPARQRFRRNGS
jgi:hypothetical protein